MRKLTQFKNLNNKGSALLQAMVVAGMITALTTSLTTLNIGRGRANIQALKKASAVNLSQIITMHLANPQLCASSVTVAGAMTPAALLANNGVDIQIRLNYPAWANNVGKNPAGSNFKDVPVNGATVNSQIGDSKLYIESIKFRIPMVAGDFDPAVTSTYALPNGAGGYRPIAKYQGTLVVQIADNSEIPIPIAPIQVPFIVNLDMTDDANPAFESCSADRGVSEYCEQLGCDWETVETLPDGTQQLLNPLDPDPTKWPRCVCGPSTVAGCLPDANGRPQYIADFNPDGTPICRGFWIDCSDPANVPASALAAVPPICYGSPLACPGWFLTGFDSQGVANCEPGGERNTLFIDCPDQVVTWFEGAWVCQASTGGNVPDGAQRNLVDSTPLAEGSGTFQCQSGQMVSTGAPPTCDNPITYAWFTGPWVPAVCGGPGVTPGPTPAPGTTMWACDSPGEVGNSCNLDRTGPLSTAGPCNLGDMNPVGPYSGAARGPGVYAGQLACGGICDPIGLYCVTDADCATLPMQCRP